MRYDRSALRGAIVGLFVLVGTACGEDDPVGVEPEESTLMVDAASEWTHVSLGEEAVVVQVGDPAASNAWHLAFNATRVMLNGGAAGPGSVVGFCVCQNEDATDAAVQAFAPGGRSEAGTARGPSLPRRRPTRGGVEWKARQLFNRPPSDGRMLPQGSW